MSKVVSRCELRDNNAQMGYYVCQMGSRNGIHGREQDRKKYTQKAFTDHTSSDAIGLLNRSSRHQAFQAFQDFLLLRKPNNSIWIQLLRRYLMSNV